MTIPLRFQCCTQAVKAALTVLYLVSCFFSIPVCAQTDGDVRTYQAEDILPYLRTYDLNHFVKTAHPAAAIRTTGAKITFNTKWDVLPFTHFRVALNDVSFRSSDGRWYVFCPCKPPTMEQLTKARTLNEVMELLAPAAKTSPDIRKFGMEVGTMIDSLNYGPSFHCDFHTAYLVGDRLMWINCRILYAESDKRKTADTPIADSNIVISRSPRLK